MLHRIARTLLLSGALLAGAAGAATLPSDLMLPEPGRAARGYVESWIFSIELESTELTGIEACRKILSERGFLPTLSKTASSSDPALHFKVAGRKAYAQASVEADHALQAVQQAKCVGTLTWSVTSQPASAAPPGASLQMPAVPPRETFTRPLREPIAPAPVPPPPPIQ
jgi:CheY-like chemotaxis protein